MSKEYYVVAVTRVRMAALGGFATRSEAQALIDREYHFKLPRGSVSHIVRAASSQEAIEIVENQLAKENPMTVRRNQRWPGLAGR